MSKAAHPPVRTTTINARIADDYTQLRSSYQLVHYQIPDSFNYSKKHFSQLHVEVKNQLNYPYYFFSPERALYVLYSSDNQPSGLAMDFLSEKELLANMVAFSELKLHVLIKLLFADYFRKPNQATFVSQGQYYIYAKPEKHYRTGDLLWDTCLEIEVNGHRKNQDLPSDQWQSFQISNHARRFVQIEKERIKDWQINLNAYFQKMRPQDGLVFFNQLRKDQIDTFEGELYILDQDKKIRAQLDYHDHKNPQFCRGKILFDFINSFIPYLGSCGLEANQQYRQMTEYRPKRDFGKLDLAHLPLVNVLDKRVNTDNPLANYVQLLSDEYSGVRFEPIQQVEPSSSTPTLILLDGTKEDFEEDGILAEYGDDPYIQIYGDEQNINTPKQSVNVNDPSDDWSGNDPLEYLDYPLPSLADKSGSNFKYKFAVSLKELLQKDFVINPRDISGILPGFPEEGSELQQFAFVRKKTYTNIGNFWVLLYFANNQLHFVDLRNSSQRRKLYELADAMHVDWGDVYALLYSKRYLKLPDQEKKLKNFDVIFGPGFAVEIEDIKETVLYEYDDIIERKSSRQQALPIDQFRLADRYDMARTGTMLPLAKMQEQGLLDNSEPVSQKQKQSIDFLTHLQAYDEFLDDLEMDHIEISFDDLTNETNMERIGQILDLKRSEKTGQYSRRGLWETYKRCGMFPGDKEKDVHLYQGIWYDNGDRFMVGSSEGLNERQARAHRIRQFDPLMGNNPFDINVFLQTLAVTFVRHKQYTVLPYLFHLIDIHVENVLRWQD